MFFFAPAGGGAGALGPLALLAAAVLAALLLVTAVRLVVGWAVGRVRRHRGGRAG